MSESAEMSEERRLMYVAITRAKEKLYITHAKSRTMYGRTGFNPLSTFIREELPTALTVKEGIRKAPPRQAPSYYQSSPQRAQYNREPRSNELHRPSDIFRKSTPQKGAVGYGIEKFAAGTRVTHMMFGNGTVISSKDMGGDVLYEVEFDNGQKKRLMATFAKLKRL